MRLIFVLILSLYSSFCLSETKDSVKSIIKDKLLDELLGVAAENYLKKSEYYNSLSKSTFSSFGKANSLENKEIRKKLQSKLSKMSKKFGNLGRELKAKGDKVKLLKKVPILSLLDSAYSEKKLSEEIEDIEKTTGIKIDRTGGEIAFSTITSYATGLTFGAFEVETTIYEEFDEKPSNSKKAVSWAKEMEERSEYLEKNVAQYSSGETEPPLGFLQYKQLIYSAQKEVMSDLGISGYINPELEWTVKWKVTDARDVNKQRVVEFACNPPEK